MNKIPPKSITPTSLLLKRQITEEMNAEEISDIISDRLIAIIEKQFEQARIRFKNQLLKDGE